MIELFREPLPDQEALVADMRMLSLKHVFTGILAWDSFFHLNHDDQRRTFAIFRAYAAPRAALMFTSGPAHGEAVGQLEGGSAGRLATIRHAEVRLSGPSLTRD
jgi:hypothetical protein